MGKELNHDWLLSDSESILKTETGKRQRAKKRLTENGCLILLFFFDLLCNMVTCLQVYTLAINAK